MHRPSLRRRSLGVAILALFLAAGAGLSARADVLETTDGLRIEGQVSDDGAGNWVVDTGDSRIVMPKTAVAGVEKGEGPRARLARLRSALASDDAAAWYRFALEAETAGVQDEATAAHETVVGLVPDHAASRRALGHERVEGEWVSAAVAHRRRGLVLFEGRWMLPAEVEAQAQTDAPTVEAASDDARTRDVIRTWATAKGELRRAARLALADAPRERRLRAALGTLYDSDPRVRSASARLLGELGDEAALRPLVLSASRDLDGDVRREAVLAAASFGHDDTAIPFVRALGSKNRRLAANAAEALAALDDPRAMAYIVKRLTSHGHSTRNFVSFLNQVSYVRDYDVEIAQASNIANPDVATILDGVILDVKVLDASYTKTWIEPVLVKAAGQLAGRRFAGRDDLLAWYAANEAAFGDFPEKPGERAKRRKQGKVLGAPMTR